MLSNRKTVDPVFGVDEQEGAALAANRIAAVGL
jgi:hypothetical protein